MALNIFPRRTPQAAPAPEPAPADLPVPSPEALQLIEPATSESDEAAEERKRTRRGTRGGRGRRKPEGAEATESGDESPSEALATPAAEDEPEAEKPAPRSRRTRRTTATAPETEAGEPAAEVETPAPAPRSRSRRRGAATQEATPEAPAVEAEAPVVAAPAAPAEPEPARPEPATREREHGQSHRESHREPRHEQPAARQGQDPTAALIRAIEQQNRQIEHLARAQEELGRKLANLGDGRGPATSSHARPARVGVFVDAANIELACDRLRARFDWGKILSMLTKDRQLVRAIAYSPVHDDPNVSIETQRFAEPFLDKGFKLVTKPFKRFADGSIKANVDIEICLEVVNMLDRLDVVCLVSGDGDFQPLVQYVQSRGVRCEVVAVGQSTASQLRQAADQYIDLGQRLKEIRI